MQGSKEYGLFYRTSENNKGIIKTVENVYMYSTKHFQQNLAQSFSFVIIYLRVLYKTFSANLVLNKFLLSFHQTYSEKGVVG